MGFWLLPSIALALWAGALLEGRKSVRMLRHGVRTQGSVVEHVKTRDSEGKGWTAVIRFTDNRGYPVEFSPRIRTAWKKRIGPTVRVIYPSEKPHNARMDTLAEMWLTTVFLVLFGIGIMYMAIDVGM